MDPQREELRLYGVASNVDPLPWSSVERQLQTAGTYWVVGVAAGHPHPRPVWGIWAGNSLISSIGSPVLRRQLSDNLVATVHLDSGTDVVVIEGTSEVLSAEATIAHVPAYDAKYDWKYTIEEYGCFTRIRPISIIAWRSAGWAGREGFQEAGRWRFAE